MDENGSHLQSETVRIAVGPVTAERPDEPEKFNSFRELKAQQVT